MSEEWRTFCAIELPDEVRSQLASHAKRLREAVPEASASWSKPENVHLTLKFFGNVSPDKLPLISAAASRLSKTLLHSQSESAALECFQNAVDRKCCGLALKIHLTA